MDIDIDIVSQVIAQSPLHVTIDDVKSIIETMQDPPTVVNILARVWNLSPPKQPRENEWDERRRIVNEIEEERIKALKGSKGQQ